MYIKCFSLELHANKFKIYHQKNAIHVYVLHVHIYTHRELEYI